MLEVTTELAGAVAQQTLRALVSWEPGLFHIIEIGMPPRALCAAPPERRMREYSLRPQGPRARIPYVCTTCHLAFMKSICQGLECPRGHGPMVLDTEGEEYFCLFCSERSYPSMKGNWAPAAKIRRNRGRRKAAPECFEPYQSSLFDFTERLEKEIA